MLELIRMSSNMAGGNQQKQLFITEFCYKQVNLFFEERDTFSISLTV